MGQIKKRKIIKALMIVFCILSIAAWITYFVLAKSDKFVKSVGGYVTSYEKVSDTEYKAQVVFNTIKNEVTREYTYETEPVKGKSEMAYYLTYDKNNLLKEKPDLYQEFIVVAIVAGVLTLITICLFVTMKNIKILRNAKVGKKIKVDPKSML